MNLFNVAYLQRIRIVFLVNSKLNNCTEWNIRPGWELANKTNNHTVSHKHRTGRISVQINFWCLYDYPILERGGETHQVYVTTRFYFIRKVFIRKWASKT